MGGDIEWLEKGYKIIPNKLKKLGEVNVFHIFLIFFY